MYIYIGCFKILLYNPKNIDNAIENLQNHLLITDTVVVTRIYKNENLIIVEVQSKKMQILSKKSILNIKYNIQHSIKYTMKSLSYNQELSIEYVPITKQKSDLVVEEGIIERLCKYFKRS